MSLLSVKNLTCVQSFKTLFENATFGIDDQDKIAVIGPNGCGKTTLLNLIANSLSVPQKEITMQKGINISYLEQKLVFNPEHTIQDHLFQTEAAAPQALRAYNNILTIYENEPSEKNGALLANATDAMDQHNAWEYEDRVTSILNELSITTTSLKMKELSGGMLKKIALAQLFFNQADILILDEPTNHLDLRTIEWLEGMLKKYQSAVVMVTHDRYFLNKVSTKILEIDQEKLFSYKGNYQTYLEQRELRYAVQDKAEHSIQSVLRVELAWLRRGPKARSTKQKARKDRVHAMINRKGLSPEKVFALNVNERRLGKKICELKNVTKSFDNKQIISEFSYTFTQGERIGIIGPNGVGKSTLLNLITDRLTPEKGEVDVGINTNFGYFDQHSQDFDLDMTIFEHISQIGSNITRHDGSTVSASKFLEQFLFPAPMLKTPIGKLSGGEKRRLHLVCLLLKNPNFLLFDEPTNDLDIQTLSVLENFLLTFRGCVLVISHDRYFMDRVVDQLFVFNENQKIIPFDGNYTDYGDTVKEIQALKMKQNSAEQAKAKDNISKPENALTLAERSELKKLEKEIEKLEKEKERLSAKFAETESTKTMSNEKSISHYAEIGKKIKINEKLIGSAMDKWSILAENL
ncbi:ABC-F family ATP-binding cassette domain-containing protein [bacterium]|jgi:ABC transport system ATP-binding/permease protein|nr:ABC-F family ATP-binding cassette domain-containing protein [bacterium]